MKSDAGDRKLTHQFEWPLPVDLTIGDAEKVGMIKGVAMSEGKLKSGENMSRDNVLSGAGAMRMSALLGTAVLDIDHLEELPQEYIEKYGPEIADPYPPGQILDAQAVENELPDGTTALQVEFIGVITNKKVYELIKTGRIKGCSVVDFVRTLECNGDRSPDNMLKGFLGEDVSGCNYEGSAFKFNTLILDAVPNSNSTWVAPVTESDIGTIIADMSDKVKDKVRASMKHALTPSQRLLINAARDGFENQTNSLEAYMTDGIWNNGADSIKDYLESEKDIDPQTADAMSRFLFKHPDALSQYQLEWLSSQDLAIWWQNLTDETKRNERTNQIMIKLAKFEWLKEHNVSEKQLQAWGKSPTREAIKYGKMDVGCVGCKFAKFTDDESDTGYCSMLDDGVERGNGCTKRRACECDTDGEKDPDANLEEAEDEDGEDNNDEVAPDEDGNCPDGYTLSEDGTVCVRAEDPDGDTGGEETQPAPVPSQKLSTKALIEANPSKNDPQEVNLEIAAVNTQINAIKNEIKSLGPVFARRAFMAGAGKRQALNDELRRLEAMLADLKKNT